VESHDFRSAISEALGKERLARYLHATSGDVGDALRLYVWNAALSAAFFEVLGDVEVIVRQAIHREFSEWHQSHGLPGEWYDNAHGFLTEAAVNDIRIAKSRLSLKRSEITPANVINELTFGFWRFLLAKHYQTTLWPALMTRVFPSIAHSDFRKLRDRIARLHQLRNLIAHHQPIYWRHLDRDFNDCRTTLRLISPECETWTIGHTRVLTLLGQGSRFLERSE
jgi:hypothetical protein